MAKISWRCFFCGDLFTDQKKAAQHFGIDASCEADEVACKIMTKPQETIVKYIRDLEGQVRELMEQVHNETHPLMEALYDVQSETESRVRRAEETGYARGIADIQKQGMCPEPQTAAVTEEIARIAAAMTKTASVLREGATQVGDLSNSAARSTYECFAETTERWVSDLAALALTRPQRDATNQSD